VHVSLFDASDTLLGDPHKVEVSGVGYYTSGDTFHVPPGANLSYRLRRNGIAGPWQQISFAAGETDWSLDFAMVSVSLFDASDNLLGDPHKVEVSGVGYYTSGDVFNVPPGANLSFRLRRNGIAGPWQQVSFAAGATSWSLDFATVSVTLYNDEDEDGIGPADLLYDPHKVEVSGVGYYTSGDVFNVPPGANLSFRLRRNGIAGPWQQRVFDVGATTWELEFATVEVQIELPADVASQTKIEVSGVGYYSDDAVFDVPPGARLSFRLRNNGWAGPWYSTDDTGVFQAGEGHLIWGLTPRYVAAP
ncbi:MAG: hypothetical protein K8I60_17835, partial [Anaerolineae bacterium]|nr:hypothetical protein [Anaerolineae bacterium]